MSQKLPKADNQPVGSKAFFGKTLLKNTSPFSRGHVLVAAVAFAIIGSYFLINSFAAGPMPRPDHVVVVMEENHAYNEIIGSSQAPYINSLAKQGAVMTSSFGIGHPSQPNYLELFSGSNQGVNSDTCLGPQGFSGPDLGGELIKAGFSFTGYAENLPSVGDLTTCTHAGYARKHDPWVNFKDVPAADHQPFSSFPANFASLPTVSFVIPTDANDMHSGTVSQADSWLGANLDSYVQWAKTHNSLLIVTWDEDDKTQNNQIPTIFVGPMVHPGQYNESITHYNTLRSLEDMYGLSHTPGSSGVNAISDIWNGSSTPTPPPTPPPPPASDTTAPKISMAAPANGATVKGMVTLSANASDNVGVARVQFHFDSSTGGDLGPLLTKAPYSYSWDTTTATDGNYTLTATAFDAAGNQTTATPVTVTVANGGTAGSTGSGGNGSGADVTINGGQAWACTGPVNLNRVVITNPVGDGAFLRTGCTGTINYLEVTGTSHDGFHINTGAHDLVIRSGKIRCLTPPGVGTATHFHQDGIQVMGGTNITIENFDDQCLTANNSAMFINEGAGGNGLPTNVVCDSCVFNSGTTAPVKIYNSQASGIRNSTIYQGKNTWIQIASGAINPVDQNNKELACPQARTIDCNNSPDNSPPPPPGQPPQSSGDTKPPSVSMTAPPSGATVSGTKVTLSANASDNVGVAGVQFELNGNYLGALDTSAPYTTTWNTTTLGNGSYTLSAVARDAAGNTTTSAPLSVTVNNPAPPHLDTTAPTTPSGLHPANAPTAASISLAWNPSTDTGGSGLAGYKLYRNGNLIISTTSLSYTDSGLQSGAKYSYKVAAYDNAGNTSALSAALSVSTPASGPPPQPQPHPGPQPTPEPKPQPYFKDGDADGDGHISIRDLSICLDLYGIKSSRADFNGDGEVNIRDLSILLSFYGKF